MPPQLEGSKAALCSLSGRHRGPHPPYPELGPQQPRKHAGSSSQQQQHQQQQAHNTGGTAPGCTHTLPGPRAQGAISLWERASLVPCSPGRGAPLFSQGERGNRQVLACQHGGHALAPHARTKKIYVQSPRAGFGRAGARREQGCTLQPLRPPSRPPPTLPRTWAAAAAKARRQQQPTTATSTATSTQHRGHRSRVYSHPPGTAGTRCYLPLGESITCALLARPRRPPFLAGRTGEPSGPRLPAWRARSCPPYPPPFMRSLRPSVVADLN